MLSDSGAAFLLIIYIDRAAFKHVDDCFSYLSFLPSFSFTENQDEELFWIGQFC